MKPRGRTFRNIVTCGLKERFNSTAVTWALYAMTQAPEVQAKLRDELLSVDTDTPSMDELIALPYLDAVVRETLRVHPPVTNTSRIAMKDDVLPVEKPYTDRYGVVRDTITFVVPLPSDDTHNNSSRRTGLPRATRSSYRSWL